MLIRVKRRGKRHDLARGLVSFSDDFPQARFASRASGRHALCEPGHAGHLLARPWPGRRIGGRGGDQDRPVSRRHRLDQLRADLLRQSFCRQRARNGEPEGDGLHFDPLSSRLDLKNARGGRRTFRGADQCERLHARLRRHRFPDVVETAKRNAGRHVATASRHDGGGERAWLSGLCANLHKLGELPGSGAYRDSRRLSRQPGRQDRRDAWGRLGLLRRRLRDRRVADRRPDGNGLRRLCAGKGPGPFEHDELGLGRADAVSRDGVRHQEVRANRPGFPAPTIPKAVPGNGSGVAKLKDGGKAPSYRPTTFRPRASHKAPGKGP